MTNFLVFYFYRSGGFMLDFRPGDLGANGAELNMMPPLGALGAEDVSSA
jgi:hypothetical protein